MTGRLHEVRFAEARLRSGLRLRYAARGPDHGAPVLFLHGYSDSSFSFSPLPPRLPATWRALAPDQRGHGDSERPARGYAMTDLAADAVALLDALGIRRASVVGHSMGSLVAQRLATDHPERVERLVLVGAGPRGANEAVRELARDVAALGDPVSADFARAFQSSTAHGPLAEAFLETAVAESLELPARVWREAAAGIQAFDVEREPGRIACPTLVLWGERDAIFGRAEEERPCKGIPPRGSWSSPRRATPPTGSVRSASPRS